MVLLMHDRACRQQCHCMAVVSLVAAAAVSEHLQPNLVIILGSADIFSHNVWMTGNLFFLYADPRLYSFVGCTCSNPSVYTATSYVNAQGVSCSARRKERLSFIRDWITVLESVKLRKLSEVQSDHADHFTCSSPTVHRV